MKLFVFTLLLTSSIFAQTVEQCGESKSVCNPPATFQFPNDPPPFSAPVKFGGAVIYSANYTFWIWLKAGEPSKPCTAADRKAHSRECSGKIGDPLFLTPRFRVVAQR